MSGPGAPDVEVDGSGLRVAVVAARWHSTVTDGLVAGALRALRESGVADPLLVRVPGAFELSVATHRLARSGYDAVVALGVVIRGGTPHFDYVCHAATEGLSRVSVETGVPVGFGVLTCDDEPQALDRAGLEGSREDKGREAALAAVATAVTLRGLGAAGERVPARISLVTLGVEDVERSKAFYRALGWEAGIDMDGFAVFRTAGALLALYPIGDLSRDAGDEVPAGRPRRTHLAINVGSPEEVDAVVAEFLAAGAGLLSAPEQAAWGGYTAIVADPDGHAWEVAHNPGWPLGADGLPRLP